MNDAYTPVQAIATCGPAEPRSLSEAARIIAANKQWFFNEWEGVFEQPGSAKIAESFEEIGHAAQALGCFLLAAPGVVSHVIWSKIPHESEAAAQMLRDQISAHDSESWTA